MKALVAAVLLLAACGTAAASAGGAPSPMAPRTVMLTTADDGKTVSVQVGDHLQIALGDQYAWELEPADGVVLVHPIQNYMLVRGTQAIWLVNATGRATVRATGSAVCASGSPCPQFAVRFSATIEAVP